MERYVVSDGKRLRCGITTGTCASAAACAAARLLLTGRSCDSVIISVPAGGTVDVPIERSTLSGDSATAVVLKDAGDDPDITNGAEICATVRLRDDGEIVIDGGEGVGRVTLPGLDQPVGAAAINSVPRKMIRQAVEIALREIEEPRGMDVVISIPKGKELAKKTFNPRLGIIDGISVLGTSGIVEPMSESALIESICVEVRMRAAMQRKTLLLTPGNYGKDFLHGSTEVPDRSIIRCSNFFGEVLKCAAQYEFDEILIVGHLGKLIKLAGNMFNTHSKYGDCRMDILTAHAAMQGIAPETAQAIMASATVDAGLDLLEPTGKVQATLSSVLRAIEKNLTYKTGKEIPVAIFTNVRGLLIQSDGFPDALERLLKEEN